VVALEVGGHSPWVSRLLEKVGHRVIVANARRVKLISQSSRKNDRLDAEFLSRLARADQKLLAPIRHRSETAQADLMGVRVRAQLVELRTEAVNAARGFRHSRDVGCYLGMRPKRDDSGQSQPELRITKEGDVYLRKLLVQCAQQILSARGPDCDLKRWGGKIAAKGKKKAKRRAVVAVVRKLAILLHRLWVSGEPYQPQRHRQMGQRAAA
jgi:transposase